MNWFQLHGGTSGYAESSYKHVADTPIVRYAPFIDVTLHFGGANCDGCENGIEPTCTGFEYWDGATDFENGIMSDSFGYITLRPQEGSGD